MEYSENVLTYKCPCCNASLVFGGDIQQLTCEYCDTNFDIETIRSYSESIRGENKEDFCWENTAPQQWSTAEQESIMEFQCPSCGGQIVTDAHTVATFCPFCDNPSIMPSRVSGGLRPDAVIPFKNTKEDAKEAFLRFCQGKPLLPKGFTTDQQLEKITGVYVPFWLYDCGADFSGSYKATRIHRWSDSQYNYTKTDHYLLRRAAACAFSGIPMDGSSKMDDAFMESIEPYDYDQIEDFDTRFLSGFYADKYDIPSENGENRIRQRVEQTFGQELQHTMLGYATVIPTSHNLQIKDSTAKYVLLPVWMLNSRYRDKRYTFAMNGQTGKLTGTLPICRKRAAIWFTGVFAVATILAAVVQLFL